MDHPPPIAFLHFLGGSAETWSPVIARIGGRADCIALDLPGWGDAAGVAGASVADMADHAERALRERAPGPWLLVGHSMGAKVAAVLARRAADGAPSLAALHALVLVAGSPPGPEPMKEHKRAEMLGWFDADPATHQHQASRFIAENVSETLPRPLHEAAVADVLRADKSRWRAWLRSGSKEDWADRVGVLQLPTLIVAGADDPMLGPDGQVAAMAPHFAHARIRTVSGAKHLLPLEQPDTLAGLILEMLP